MPMKAMAPMLRPNGPVKNWTMRSAAFCRACKFCAAAGSIADMNKIPALTVAMVEVVEMVGLPTVHQTAPKPVAEILTETLREADTVARMDDGVFAVLLEDTPENGAIWTLERIRRRVSEELQGCTLRAGMSCYPAYAFDAGQLVEQSLAALEAAREWKQDRIEVTTASPED